MSDFTSIDIDQVRTSLGRLEASAIFAQSERMLRFLHFVVEEALAGRGDRLNQTAIAIEVFDRDAGFDPAADAVVRVEAGRLRAKLREYYDADGRSDPLRITIPKGRYIPEFVAGPDNVTAAADSGAAVGTDLPAAAVRDDRPAIAVLPFHDIGGDSRNQAFSEGLTEDIITGLSAYRWCPVIARHSTFGYENKGLDLKAVARELRARYIVEGSVRRSGEQIRINVQFIDAVEDLHLWAERFDRELGNIFAVQDEIAGCVVASIAPEFRQAEIERTLNKEPGDLNAWECVNRGLWHLTRRNVIHNRLARQFLEKSRDLDSTSPAPFPQLAVCNLLDWTHGWADDAQAALDEALGLARQGVGLDPDHADSHAAVSACLKELRRHDEAVDAARRAIELNPYSHHGHHCLGSALCFAGSPGESIAAFEQALRRNPRSIDVDIILSSMALDHLLLKNFQEAADFARRSIHANPKLDRSYYRLAAALAYSGDTAGAKEILAESQRLATGPPRRYLEKLHPFKNPADFELLLEGLSIAGWQEPA